MSRNRYSAARAVPLREITNEDDPLHVNYTGKRAPRTTTKNSEPLLELAEVNAFQRVGLADVLLRRQRHLAEHNCRTTRVLHGCQRTELGGLRGDEHGTAQFLSLSDSGVDVLHAEVR